MLRFHAVYWPAMPLSAGEPPPTDIVVHDYLTVDGRKISESGGTTVEPAVLAERYGTDAVRWWLLCGAPGSEGLRTTCREAFGLVGAALSDVDFRRATAAVWAIVDEVNRYGQGAPRGWRRGPPMRPPLRWRPPAATETTEEAVESRPTPTPIKPSPRHTAGVLPPGRLAGMGFRSV